MESTHGHIAGSRLLIVDDEPVLAMTFAIVLRRAGATVLTAANGQDALAMLEVEHVDAMLCDQRMPVMDGPTLLRKLRDSGRTVPTVLFVNGVDPEDTASLQSMNVRRTVTKPLQPMFLLETFDSLLKELQSETRNMPLGLHGGGNINSQPA